MSDEITTARFELLTAIHAMEKVVRTNTTNDFQSKHIAECREWLGHTTRLLDVLASLVDESERQGLARRQEIARNALRRWP